MSHPAVAVKMLTATEVAALLRMKPQTIYAMARHGRIPTIKIGARRLFPEYALLRWIDEQTIRPDSERDNGQRANGLRGELQEVGSRDAAHQATRCVVLETRAEAEEYARQLVVEQRTGRPTLAPGAAAVRNLSSRFLSSVQSSDRADTTKVNYEYRVGGFIDFLDTIGVSDIRDLSPDVVDLFRMHLTDKYAQHTVHSTLAVISAMLNYGVRMRMIPFNPAQGIVPPQPETTRRALTSKERKRVLDDTPQEHRAVWGLFLWTGMRLGELANCPAENVHLDGAPSPLVHVIGKGHRGHRGQRKVRDIPLTPTAVEFVTDMLHRAPGGRLSPFTYRALQGRWSADRDRLELPKEITIHCFRHDFATRLVNETDTKLTECQRVLGHSNIRQTAAYVHEDFGRLVRGMGQLDGADSGTEPVQTEDLKSVTRHE